MGNSTIRCMVGWSGFFSFLNLIALWYLVFEPRGESEKGLRKGEKMFVRNYTKAVSGTNSWKNWSIFTFSFVMNQNVLFAFPILLLLLNDIKILPNTLCIKWTLWNAEGLSWFVHASWHPPEENTARLCSSPGCVYHQVAAHQVYQLYHTVIHITVYVLGGTSRESKPDQSS